MTGPRRLPAGWHAAPPELRATDPVERVVDDDAPDPAPALNRADRRRLARALKKGNRR